MFLEPDANFDCRACGQCCRTDWNVRVEADKAELFARLGPPLRIIEDSGGSCFTAKIDGRCAFLGPDQLCQIHAKLGAQAKPDTCRLFPFVVVPTPSGPAVGLSYYCPSVRAKHGRALTEQAAEIARLVAVLDPPPEAGRPLRIHGLVTTGWTGYQVFEQELMARLARGAVGPMLRGLRWGLLEKHTEWGRCGVEEFFPETSPPVSRVESQLVARLLAMTDHPPLLGGDVSEGGRAVLRRYLLSLVHRKFLLRSPTLLEGVALLSLLPQAVERCGPRLEQGIEQLELLLSHGPGTPGLVLPLLSPGKKGSAPSSE